MSVERVRLMLWEACDDAIANGKQIADRSFTSCPIKHLKEFHDPGSYDCIESATQILGIKEHEVWAFVNGFDGNPDWPRARSAPKFAEMGLEFRKEYIEKS